MNDYVSHQIQKNKKVYCYTVYENWIDIRNTIDYNE
jgi:hypothetical protein